MSSELEWLRTRLLLDQVLFLDLLDQGFFSVLVFLVSLVALRYWFVDE